MPAARVRVGAGVGRGPGCWVWRVDYEERFVCWGVGYLSFSGGDGCCSWRGGLYWADHDNSNSNYCTKNGAINFKEAERESSVRAFPGGNKQSVKYGRY